MRKITSFLLLVSTNTSNNTEKKFIGRLNLKRQKKTSVG